MSERKYVRQPIGEVDIVDTFNDSVTGIIDTLQEYVEKYGDSVSFIAAYYGYDGGIEVDAYYMREETDEEMFERITKEKKDLERKERARLKRLEKAAKKLEAEAEKKKQIELDELAELKRLQEKYSEHL